MVSGVCCFCLIAPGLCWLIPLFCLSTWIRSGLLYVVWPLGNTSLQGHHDPNQDLPWGFVRGTRVFYTVSATGKLDTMPEAKRLHCSVCFRASGGCRNGTVLENDELPPEFPGLVLGFMDC